MMVRTSDIAKKGIEGQSSKKVDALSAFLRLSEIMQIKASGETAAKPAPAIDETASPAVPATGIMQQETGADIEPETGDMQHETDESPGLAAKTDDHGPSEVAFNEQKPDKVEDLYATSKQTMHEIRAAVLRNQSPDIAPLREVLKKIISQPALIQNTHPLTLGKENEQDYYLFQPIHTMFYALKLGLHMSYSAQQLSELGLCCLLQNIGMFLVPDQIINKRGVLTAEEISVIRQHPEMGRNLLQPYQDDCPWLLKSVYQHHERENGQGYPLGIKGDEIAEYAKIIGLCDSYEAMTHSRPHRKAIMQFDSVRQLIQSKEGLFPSQILKVFLAELTIYPIGSYVRLNNAAIGRVIATNRAQPMRPVIDLLVDGKGNRVAMEERIDLANNHVLTVLDVVPEEDIPR